VHAQRGTDGFQCHGGDFVAGGKRRGNRPLVIIVNERIGIQEFRAQFAEIVHGTSLRRMLGQGEHFIGDPVQLGALDVVGVLLGGIFRGQERQPFDIIDAVEELFLQLFGPRKLGIGRKENFHLVAAGGGKDLYIAIQALRDQYFGKFFGGNFFRHAKAEQRTTGKLHPQLQLGNVIQ